MSKDAETIWVLPEVVVTAFRRLRKFEWRNNWNLFLGFYPWDRYKTSLQLATGWYQIRTTYRFLKDTGGILNDRVILTYHDVKNLRQTSDEALSMLDGGNALFPRFPQSKVNSSANSIYHPGISQSDIYGQTTKTFKVEDGIDNFLVQQNINPFDYTNPGYTKQQVVAAWRQKGEAEAAFINDTIVPILFTTAACSFPYAVAAGTIVWRGGKAYFEKGELGPAVEKALVRDLREHLNNPNLKQEFEEHPARVTAALAGDVAPLALVIFGGTQVVKGTVELANRPTNLTVTEKLFKDPIPVAGNAPNVGRSATKIENKGSVGNQSGDIITAEHVKPNFVQKPGNAIEELSKAEEAIATTGKNIQKFPAEKVNLTYPKDYEPPYKVGTMATEFTTTSEKNFVRVHGTNNRERAWVMEKREIEGLTPEQIKDKFALPEIPTHITDVKVPEGTRMRMGIAERNKFGSGEGIQYELLDVLDGPEFWQNTRKLGE